MKLLPASLKARLLCCFHLGLAGQRQSQHLTGLPSFCEIHLRVYLSAHKGDPHVSACRDGKLWKEIIKSSVCLWLCSQLSDSAFSQRIIVSTQVCEVAAGFRNNTTGQEHPTRTTFWIRCLLCLVAAVNLQTKSSLRTKELANHTRALAINQFLGWGLGDLVASNIVF